MTLRVTQYLSGCVFGGALLIAGVAGAQNASTSTVSDAQVEANVLRALASAPELSTQNIQSTTVYGTVTLSGNVHDEALRTKAENLVARASGVKKVVDQLTLGDTPAATQTAQMQPDPQNGNQPQGQVLQSDGTYAPADASQQPGNDNPPPPPAQAQNNSPYYGPQNNGPANGGPQGPPPPPSGRQPMGQNYGPNGPTRPIPGGQVAGVEVTVPAGAVLRVRINRGLDSNHIQPGATFDGTVLTDVVAGGAVAIPRGATIQGTVVDAKKAGVFKGEGQLGLQLNTLTLGGNVYPLNTEVWQANGRDKTAGTVNNTVGLGALGALFGAVAGGGTGAAIGAGVGGAAGLAGSAASPRGQVILPPESVLSFRTSAPAVVKTVSEQEMGRLSYAAGPGQGQPRPPMRRYYSPYYGYYYGPAY
jgi:hypothetical protein